MYAIDGVLAYRRARSRKESSRKESSRKEKADHIDSDTARLVA